MLFSASGLIRGDKVKLAALVTYHGGEYSRSFDEKCTHLVTHRSIGVKYDKAKNRRVTCVTPGWVLTSAKNRQLQNSADYDPANVIPGSEVIPEIGQNQSNPTPTVSTPTSQPTAKIKAVRSIRRKESPNAEKRPRAKPQKKQNSQSPQISQNQPIQQQTGANPTNQRVRHVPTTSQSMMIQGNVQQQMMQNQQPRQIQFCIQNQNSSNQQLITVSNSGQMVQQPDLSQGQTLLPASTDTGQMKPMGQQQIITTHSGELQVKRQKS
jgi:PAX-interacting protein 1